tara:strand:+ start:609 stop:1046 length:438 start_codon:yes stop_codon:yes gene_type:complete
MIINIIYSISKMRRLVREDSGDLKLSIRAKYAFELERKKETMKEIELYMLFSKINKSYNKLNTIESKINEESDKLKIKIKKELGDNIGTYNLDGSLEETISDILDNSIDELNKNYLSLIEERNKELESIIKKKDEWIEKYGIMNI